SNGFLAGTSINSFAIELAAAGNNAINNLVVKMKNSSITAFATTSSWESGMTVVKAASSHTAVVGANTFVLDTPFVWDGSSSLVIEVNYQNNNSGTGSNTTARYDNTSFASTLFYRYDSTSQNADTYTGAAT